MEEDYMQWFEHTQKPEWGIDFEMFGEFWIIAYPLAILAFCIMVYLVWESELPKRVLWPVGLNIVFSLAAGAFMIGLPYLGFVLVLMLLYAITLGWVFMELTSIRQWTPKLLLVPYAVWVVSGLVIILELVRLNWL